MFCPEVRGDKHRQGNQAIRKGNHLYSDIRGTGGWFEAKSGCGQQPGRKRPPTHPGRCPPRPAPANRKAQLADPALWPPPSPEATHHFPSGRQHSLAFPLAPLRMAPWPPPFLPPRKAEPPPASARPRRPTRDRGRWEARLKISRIAGTLVCVYAF